MIFGEGLLNKGIKDFKVFGSFGVWLGLTGRFEVREPAKPQTGAPNGTFRKLGYLILGSLY